MELFNIGPLEFILIIVLAVVILGPEQMVKGAYSMGRWINKFVRSPMWKEIMSTSQDIRELPTKIMRDTGLEESLNEIKQTTQDVTTELNSTLKQANDEVKQAVDETNAEVRQATNELNDTANQALNDTNQEVGKISNPDDAWKVPEIDEGWTIPKTSKAATAGSDEAPKTETADGEPVDDGEPQPVDLAETQPANSPDVKDEGNAEPQSESAPELQPAAMIEAGAVTSVQQLADKEELKPVPVLSHLQEILPEILPVKPTKPLIPDPPVLQPTLVPAGSVSVVSKAPVEELYEAKLNQVLVEYEVELRKILELYKADLRKAAQPVEKPSHPAEITALDKLE